MPSDLTTAPLQMLSKRFKRKVKGCLTIVEAIFPWAIEGKLIEKCLKTTQKTSLKLPLNIRKLLINM